MDSLPTIIDLDGGLNFRDIGGYVNGEGLRIRPNLVYRSGSLSSLTAQGKTQLGVLGVTSVIDLRSDEEVAKAPDQLPFGIKYLHLPIKDPSRLPRMRAAWAVLVKRNHLSKTLLDGYTRVMIDANGPKLGEALRHIAASDGATVVHCTAGKDRTGVLIAILLRLLQMPDSLIESDYMLSNQFSALIAQRVKKEIDLLRRAGLNERQIRPILEVDPTILRDTFSHISLNYGSLTNYLDTKCRVDAALRLKLRERLLESVD